MKISVNFFFPSIKKTIISWSWNWTGLSHNMSNYNAWGRDFMNEMVGMLDFVAEHGFMAQSQVL